MDYILNDVTGIPDRDTFLTVRRSVNFSRIIPFVNRISTRSAARKKSLSFFEKRYQVNNLDFLCYFPNLDFLFLEDTSVDTLAPLAACIKIETLCLYNLTVADGDFTPIGKLPLLKRFTVENCGLTNIEWISNLGCLEVCGLDENDIPDFSPIKTVPSLEIVSVNHLDVYEAPFDDLP